MPRLELVPCSVQDAKAFIDEHHSKLDAPVSAYFALGVAWRGRVVAVATVGRPVAKGLQDGFTAEVTRNCVDRTWLDPHEEGTIAGAWVRARELGLTGLAHAEYALRALWRAGTTAASMLYGAAWRAARALGWRKLVTYTHQTEPGTSLVAAGWHVVAEVKARSWSCPSRPRVDRSPLQAKFRWEAPCPA